ncbi:MAG: PhoH family protein [Bacteroidia bacterium]
MSHKKYVLDTSVLIHDFNSIQNFRDNDVIIPIAVLEELDHLKVRTDNAGSNARIAIRNIDNYIKDKDTSKGVDIGNDIILFIDVMNTKDEKFNAGNKDDAILACVMANDNAILVSKDINMRIRAQAYGIKTQDYNNDKIKNISELYNGYREINFDELNIYDDITNGVSDVKGTVFEDMYPNECVQVTSNGKKSIFRKKENALCPIRLSNDIWGIKSRNREQAFAMDLLMDTNLPLVSLIGRAGGGKTLITIAAALELCINQKKYSSIKIYRPIQPVGNDIGYIPGSIAEKLQPWFGAVYDSLELLMGPNYEQILGQYQDKLKMEAMTYIRGRSINKSLIIIDEAQNLTQNEIKTILTRVGFDSKVIISGDIEQIDNRYITESNNGLTYVVESFKGSKMFGHTTLVKGERSPLATEASRLL